MNVGSEKDNYANTDHTGEEGRVNKDMHIGGCEASEIEEGEASSRNDLPYAFKINSITLNDAYSTVFQPAQLTVVIGPNNSGKSRLLKEVRAAILGKTVSGHFPDAHECIVTKAIELNMPQTEEQFDAAYNLDSHLARDMHGQWHVRDYCGGSITIEPSGMINRNQSMSCSSDIRKEVVRPFFRSLQDAQGAVADGVSYGVGQGGLTRQLAERNRFLAHLGSMFVDYAGTEDRLLLSIGEPRRGPIDQEMNTLSISRLQDETLCGLFRDTERLFGRDVILDDVTAGGVIHIKAGNRGCFNFVRESVRKNPVASELIEAGRDLKEEGDGIRSFVAVELLLRMQSSRKPVILLDEPEAFLHPPQAYELGRIIAQSVSADCQIMVATHSAHLLRGIVDETAHAPSGQDKGICIIRMQRRDDGFSAKEFSSDAFSAFLKDAIFRNSHALEGLFSKRVIVVESEGDELFFQTLVNKLSAMKKDGTNVASMHVDACQDVLFINVHGKHRIGKTVQFYRSLGIPCFAIVDFDVFDDSATCKDLVNAIGCKGDEISTIESVATRLQDSARDILDGKSTVDAGRSNANDVVSSSVSGGKINSLFKNDTETITRNMLEDVDDALEICRSHGLLIIRTGEMESTLEPLEPYSNNKPAWLERALGKINDLAIEDLETLSITQDIYRLFDHAA